MFISPPMISAKNFIYFDNIPCLFFYFTDDSLLQVFTFFHSTA
ncbi:hypothetical protein CGLO_09528 [Colletotrichum gloeosporioides Cg-14]|uniref:Uncharacterized protein n=1 Tax=Colletotrichum gloeosporioides (strain Cg-14) TaxID=1237896 RepID=T0LRY0_COLGC|nr:hypothetical protein CGLO_09528 [Colletotrichum gloeosporioides Cg-14]